MKRAFVTGANGFIGSHLVRHLLERGYEVDCLVRATSDLRSIEGLPVRIHVGDVRQPETLTAALEGADYVFHLAAELLALTREAFLLTNTKGTVHMLDAVLRAKGPGFQRFLYVSSQAAAGPGADTTPLNEAAERRPMSWYGTSKSDSEEIVMQYAARLPVTIVRPSSVYGAREQDLSQTYPLVDSRIHPKLGIRPKYIVAVFVDDLVRGFVDAAESGNTLGKTYFLNHKEVLSASDVIQGIANGMDKSAGVTIPVPLFLIQLAAPAAELMHRFTRGRPAMTRDKAREVSQRFWVADPGAAQRDFGWVAQQNISQGMRATTQAWRAERDAGRAMALEDILWAKYLIVASAIGGLIEAQSHLGGFYTFNPAWLVWVVIFGGFGLVLGTLAMLLRRTGPLPQFLIGTALAGAAEVLNAAVFHAWTFREGWPLGITNAYERAILLGGAGGIFVVLVNLIMQALYGLRLSKGDANEP